VGFPAEIAMFAGAARRLVANLTVDECLSRRKEGIATELMREIAPVVSGHGRVDDETDMGWGVIIDTIEIQDARILSSAVFSNMQARYRQTQAREAREAALTTERAVKLAEAEATRRIESAVSPAAVRLVIAQRMPDLAAAFQQNMGHVNVTAVGGENPFGFIVAAVGGVLGMARATGLELPMASGRTPAS